LLQSVCLLVYTKVQFEIDCNFELCPCTSRAQGRPNMSALYSSNRGPRLSLRCKPISEFNLCCRRPRCRTPRRRVVHLGRSLPIPNCSGASPSQTSGCHGLPPSISCISSRGFTATVDDWRHVRRTLPSVHRKLQPSILRRPCTLAAGEEVTMKGEPAG
jgi:hypothetical protein